MVAGDIDFLEMIIVAKYGIVPILIALVPAQIE